MPAASQSFLQELDDVVSRGSAESRAKALAYTTDMLVAGHYAEDEIWVFGEVMGRLSDAMDFGFVHPIKRAKSDPVLVSQIGLRSDIPKPIFQQLIAKASADVRRKLEHERPELAGEIQTSVAEVAGLLQSSLASVPGSYVTAEKLVPARHRLGRLNEIAIGDYARVHRSKEATVGLSLLCALPVEVVEQAMADPEMVLILAKAKDFAWETVMSLLFLGAKDHRIKAGELESFRDEFARLNTRTSQDVLSFYRSPRQAGVRDTLH